MRRLFPLLLASALAVPAAAPACRSAAAQGGTAPFTIAETGQGFGSLQEAVNQIGGGQGTIVIAPGTYRDCAVQSGGRIVFRAAEPGTAVFDGGICEDKAALVLDGNFARVDGLVFRGMRVGDGNGAGIRAQKGDLEVVNAMFLDSQEGILGRDDDAGRRITIDRSTFAGLGQCDESNDCAHSIYLGSPGQVTITRSRFERGHGGHYVKLRVANVTIADNSFDDTAGRKTNYMIDLPEGSRGVIRNNTFVQGAHKENWSGLLVGGAEGRTYPSAGLTVTDNVATLAPGQSNSPAFVASKTKEPLRIAANRLGTGIRMFEQR